MDKVQLLHPEGKKAIAMDRKKYDMLMVALMDCLQSRQPQVWTELLTAVEAQLKKKKNIVEGKLEWNLFWVTLDLVAKKKINKDKTATPILYALC